MVVPYDAGFQTAIGGYPLKAHVLDTSTNVIWESLVDNNTATIGGTNWSVPVFVDPNTAGLIVYGASNSNGANIKLQGNGAAPSKWIRAQGGHLQVLNNAYSSVILDLDDTGTATVNAARAAIGAFGSGDSTRVPNLSDFALTTTIPGYQRLPNGFMIQWGRFVSVTGNGDIFNWPTAFPHAGLQVIGCDDGSQIASASFSFINTGFAQVRMWCGFQNNGATIYTTGTGILWIALGY